MQVQLTTGEESEIDDLHHLMAGSAEYWQEIWDERSELVKLSAEVW
jgi:hypothetical protein